MDKELLEQMQADIELAKTMSEIGSAPDVRNLVNNLIGYMDTIIQAIATHEYKASQLAGKKRVLEEYIRNGKEIAKELSIANSLSQRP